jgi:UPF0716 protein FxsA
VPFLVLILIMPVLEIWILVRVGSEFGVVNVLFALAAAMILGGGLAKAQGRYMMQTFQNSVARGEVPNARVFHSLLIFIGGILLFIPGFLSDAVGILMILPGTRHLLALWLRAKMTSQIRSGNFRAFSSVNFGGFGAGFGFPGGSSGMNRDPRDVSPKELDASQEIIDITPIAKDDKDV